MKRKLLAILLSVSMIATLVTACGSKEASDNSAKEEGVSIER